MESGDRVRRLAVLGHPAAHSRSPAMQNAALAELSKQGLEGEWVYEDPIDVPPRGFRAKVKELAAAGYVGANVTIPHKEAALWVADDPSPAAREIGAANTLSFDNGKIRADNTDAGGLLWALADLPASPRGTRALVLGAGGAARAAVWGLAKGGSVVHVDLEPFVVDVWNRTHIRGTRLYGEIGEHADLGGFPVDSPQQHSYAVVVNTTSVGLHDEDPFEYLPLDREPLRGQLVVDLVYGDRPTELVEAARENGAVACDGIEVLVRQGALSLQIWTGLEPPVEVMRAAARR